MFEITGHKIWCIFNEAYQKKIIIVGFNDLGKELYHKLRLLINSPIQFADFTDKSYIKEEYQILPLYEMMKQKEYYYIITNKEIAAKCFHMIQEQKFRMFFDYRFLYDCELSDFISENKILNKFLKNENQNTRKRNTPINSGHIYVISHKWAPIPKDNLYRPIQVGMSNENIYSIRDNSGKNIAEKNPYYCELTAYYWLWKNTNEDYIGIVHYRRFFYLNNKLLTEKDIIKLLYQYDIIVPKEEIPPGETSILTQYVKTHYPKDLMQVKEIIEKKYPDYLNAFYTVLKKKSCSWYNILITRKNIFDKYCSWLFDILFDFENRREMEWENPYQDRVFGFLAERLFNVWLLKNHYNIFHLDVFLGEIRN